MSELDKGVSLEEALTRAKFGKFNYFLVPLCGMLFLCWFYEVMGVGYYLPVAECDLGITSKQDYGIINGMSFAGLILSYHLWGFLADTRGRRKILIISLLIALSFTIISSFSTSFWMLAVLKFFNGFFVSASSCIVFAYMGEFHNSKNRSRVLMMASTMYGAFGLLLPVFAWLIINEDWKFDIPLINITFKPWRIFVLFCGMPSLIAALGLYFCPETPKFVYSMGNEEKTLRILRKIHSINTGNDNYDIQRISDPEFGTAEKTSTKDYLTQIWKHTCILFNRTYLRTTVVMCLLQIGACSLGIGMLLYFPKVLNTIAVFTKTVSSDHDYTVCDIMDHFNSISSDTNSTFVGTELTTTICIDKMDITSYTYPMLVELLYTAGFFTVGLLVNYVGVIPLSVLIFMANAISAIVLIFSKIPTLSIYLYVILLLNGLNNNMIGTATIELYPTFMRSSAVSISLICGRLGSLVGSNIVGFLYDHHCSMTFIVCGALFTFSSVVAFLLPKNKNVSPEINQNNNEQKA